MTVTNPLCSDFASTLFVAGVAALATPEKSIANVVTANALKYRFFIGARVYTLTLHHRRTGVWVKLKREVG